MSIFKKAQIIEAPASTAKGKKQKHEVQVSNLEKLAMAAHLRKLAASLESSVGEVVKEDILNEFVDEGCKIARRPDNFTGIDGKATASCQLKVRSSALSDDERNLLDEHLIPYVKEVKSHQMYVINPAYFSDQELLEKVSDAMSSIDGFPEDFILLKEEEVKHSIDDETLNVCFSKLADATYGDEEFFALQSILKTVTTIAVMPKISTTFAEAVAVVGESIE